MPKSVRNLKLKKVTLVEDSDNATKIVILTIVSLISIFFLIFLEKTILPWPWLAEELAKAIIIFFFILPINCGFCRWLGVFIFALTFAISENIFYFLNFINNNDPSIYWQRFVWPLAMHLLTTLIIFSSVLKKKKWWYLGLVLAMAIHWYYNSFLVINL